MSLFFRRLLTSVSKLSQCIWQLVAAWLEAGGWQVDMASRFLGINIESQLRQIKSNPAHHSGFHRLAPFVLFWFYGWQSFSCHTGKRITTRTKEKTRFAKVLAWGWGRWNYLVIKDCSTLLWASFARRRGLRCRNFQFNFNSKLLKINYLDFGTQNDLRFANVSANDLEFGPSLVLSNGETAVFYGALQHCFGRDFQGDVDCDAEAFNSNQKTF